MVLRSGSSVYGTKGGGSGPLGSPSITERRDWRLEQEGEDITATHSGLSFVNTALSSWFGAIEEDPAIVVTKLIAYVDSLPTP